MSPFSLPFPPVSSPPERTQRPLTPSLTIPPGTLPERPPSPPFDVPTASSAETEAGAPDSAPFALVLYQREKTPDGRFRPEAAIEITPALRTCGLLATLPAEEWQSLLAVLTFVTANGTCQPSLSQIATALKRPESKTCSRMLRLAAVLWQGHPLVTEMVQESGRVVYAPSRRLYTIRHEAGEERTPSPAPSAPAGREAVIAHSRSLYARPRVEVEREIARLNGWEDPHPQTPEEKERLEILRRLLGVGIAREQAESLCQRFSAEAITRQIDWLPYRNANHPARFLIAAIEGDYEAPFPIRLQHASQETEAIEQATSTADDASEVRFQGMGGEKA